MKHTILTSTVVTIFATAYFVAARQQPNVTIVPSNIVVEHTTQGKKLSSTFPMIARIPGGKERIALGYYASIECAEKQHADFWNFTKSHCGEAVVKNADGRILLTFRLTRPLVIEAPSQDTINVDFSGL